MEKSSKGAGYGIWVAIIIIIAILAAYGGYYSGLYASLQETKALPSIIGVGVIVSNVTYASDLLDGVLLATKVVNSSGGIASRNLTALVRFTGGDPGTAKSMVTSLVNEGVRVFIGALSSPEVEVILPIIRESNAVLVLVSKDVYDVYDPMVIKVFGGPDVEALAMADLALKVGTRAAIIAINDSYGAKLADAINKKYSAQGGMVVYKLLYGEDINVTAYLEKIKDLKDPPVVIFLIGYIDDARTILTSASNVQLNVTWILSSTLADDRLLSDDLASYLEGSYAVVRRALVESPQLLEFVELYIKEYHKMPSEMAAYGFDLLKLIALSIAWAGYYDGQAIKKAIDTVISSFSGATGRKVLDHNGNVLQEYEVLKIIKVGEVYKFETVGYWIPISATKAFINWTIKQ
ncbi:MAG: ABC transporter substrate-binding protein [Candidatus Nezhaarchaeales archaeon]